MSYEVLLWLGARLPFAAAVTIVGFFTYLYHIAPFLPWLLVFFAADFAVIVCWPPKQIGTRHRGMWDWSPMFAWFLAIGAAVGVGLLNYGILESWINTAFLQEYKNVQPNTAPSAVSDAGVLTFAPGTHVDTSSAAGYKFWFYNYCAAPIVGEDPTDFPVTYWAVGVGCCQNRGEFTCDSAEDASAISGMPLRPYNIGPEITSHYNRAINMSAATSGIEVSKERVFVRWHKDPKGAGNFHWWIASSLFFGFVLLSFCACGACQETLLHVHEMRKLHG
jgi:hypothetical protein